MNCGRRPGWSPGTGACSSTSSRRPGSATRPCGSIWRAGLRDVGRPEADHEEADLTVHWVGLRQAVDQVLAGEIVNSTAAAGVLAAHAVIVDGKPTRPVDAPWPDRPTAFAARQVRP